MNAAPIRPKTAPDAPRLIVLGGNKNKVKMFPINPEVKYRIIYLILENSLSINAPNMKSAKTFEKKCIISA
jgi:hypothetical protein